MSTYTQTTSWAPCASYLETLNRIVHNHELRVTRPQTMRVITPPAIDRDWSPVIHGGSLPVVMHLMPQVEVARRPCSYGDLPQSPEASKEELQSFSHSLQQWSLLTTKMEDES